MYLLAIATAALAAIGGFIVRRRLTDLRAQSRLTDDHIRVIEDSGWLELDDEPLDWQEIREEEERFWEEEEEPWRDRDPDEV